MSELELEGAVLDVKYTLDRRLGAGGMGEVWRGRHRLTGRRVAVKFLLEPDEKMRSRFLTEALAMGRLTHPNVIDIYDVGSFDGHPYIVMEYLVGRPLSDFVTEGGLPSETSVKLIMPALAGIAAAHQADLLHRDLKPDNLFVLCEEDGTPFDTKVLDFGVARLGDSPKGNRLTVSGAVVGTPRYLPPEALEDDVSTLDERADVYGVGLILFELLTGRSPFQGKSIQALLVEVLTSTPRSVRELVPEVPEGLSDAVAKALARSPDDRYTSIEALALALEPFGDGVAFRRPRPSKATRWNLPDALRGPLPWDRDAPSQAPVPDADESRQALALASTSAAVEPPTEPPSPLGPERPSHPTTRSDRRRPTVHLDSDPPPPPMAASTGTIRLPQRRSPLLFVALGGLLILGAAGAAWAGLRTSAPDPADPGEPATPTSSSEAAAPPDAVSPDPAPPLPDGVDDPAPAEVTPAQLEPPPPAAPTPAPAPVNEEPARPSQPRRPPSVRPRPDRGQPVRPRPEPARPAPTPDTPIGGTQPAADRPIDPFAE